MNGNTMIGFCDRYVRCKYCGKEFHYNGCDPEQGLRANEDRIDHEDKCPVRSGIEECPKEWKERLERYDNRIKSCEKDIKELEQGLEAGTIPLLLKEATEQLIKMKKVEIEAYRKSIDPDYKFKDLLKIKKGDVIIPSFFQG